MAVVPRTDETRNLETMTCESRNIEKKRIAVKIWKKIKRESGDIERTSHQSQKRARQTSEIRKHPMQTERDRGGRAETSMAEL
jgi:hypothetical protein